MYAKFKELADEAIALQNKDRMDAALREISALCAPSVANKSFAEAVAAETGGKVVTYGEADLVEHAPIDIATKLATAKHGDLVFPDGDETKAAPADVLAAAKPGDTVQATIISEGEAKFAPSERHTGLGSPIVTAILADADRPKPRSVLKREAKKGGAK
jgi:hypothetical protein